jgi:hypothetical protein
MRVCTLFHPGSRYNADKIHLRSPIPRSWDKTIPGTCIQIGDVWYSTSVMSIVTDLAIILLPIYQIRKLRLPLSQKLGLCVLFSLGFL